jgi:hypothetical protein
VKCIRSFGARDSVRRVFAVRVSDVEAFCYGADGVEIVVWECWWLGGLGAVVVSHVAESCKCLLYGL